MAIMCKSGSLEGSSAETVATRWELSKLLAEFSMGIPLVFNKCGTQLSF
jgi:hypothetical protein